MLQANRRMTFKLLGSAALTAATLPILSRMAAAQEDLVVPNTYQNFKRGTIHSLHPERRIFNIVWEDLGRVKMRAADLVTNYPSLKVGNIVDTHWYDYLDFMVVPKTAPNDAQAKAMLAKGARLQGIPGMQEPIKLWRMDGMVTKVDGATIYPDQCLGRQARRAVARQRRGHPAAGGADRRGPGRREVRQGRRHGDHRVEPADGHQGHCHPLKQLPQKTVGAPGSRGPGASHFSVAERIRHQEAPILKEPGSIGF